MKKTKFSQNTKFQSIQIRIPKPTALGASFFSSIVQFRIPKPDIWIQGINFMRIQIRNTRFNSCKNTCGVLFAS
jgi:hypothetical protein